VSGGDRSERRQVSVSPVWMKRARSSSVASVDRFNTRAKNATVMSGGQVGKGCRQAGLAPALAPLTGGPSDLIFQLTNNCQNQIIPRKIAKW
jgi:hypothetical protein